MAENPIHWTIVDALQDAGVAANLDLPRLTAFATGEVDIPLAELALDSLTRMELLVALEIEFGVVVLPNAFARFRSLGDLVQHVKDTEGAAGASPSEAGLPAGLPGPTPAISAGAPRIARLFQRAFGYCSTVAEMHLLLSHLADRMSPLEAVALIGWQRQGRLVPPEAPPKFSAALTEWLNAFDGALQRSGKAAPEPFLGRRVSPAAMHYVGPGDRAEKTLLVGFSVKGSRTLSIAQAVFLQHVDSTKYDVLMISDLLATAFRAGVPILGADIHAVVQWVADLPMLREYARLRTAGCSAGVYPATLTGRRIGAELVVGFNGRFPSERYLGTLVKMYCHSWLSSARHRRSRVLLVHGETKRRDVAFAKRLGWLTGARRLAVRMPGRDLGHNVLPPLVEHGELTYFLERTLFAPLDSDWLASSGGDATVQFPVTGA